MPRGIGKSAEPFRKASLDKRKGKEKQQRDSGQKGKEKEGKRKRPSPDLSTHRDDELDINIQKSYSLGRTGFREAWYMIDTGGPIPSKLTLKPKTVNL